MNKLTGLEVRQIKEHLWIGVRQKLVARAFRVSQPTVSQISRGGMWFEVPWPDGSIGAMPLTRRAELEELSKREEEMYIHGASDRLPTDHIAHTQLTEASQRMGGSIPHGHGHDDARTGRAPQHGAHDLDQLSRASSEKTRVQEFIHRREEKARILAQLAEQAESEMEEDFLSAIKRGK